MIRHAGPLRRLAPAVAAAVAAAAILALAALAALALADFMAAGGASSPSARLLWAVHHGDHLHFAVHVAAGRLLDLCPCTRRAAGTQYVRAGFHARTPAQSALLANTRPRTAEQWLAYATAPVSVGVEWLGDGLAWLGGSRPASDARVGVAFLEFAPAELHVATGTTVTWNNDDDDDAHTVVADDGSFRSIALEPGETFARTFAQRGRYQYFCSIHGHAGLQGMAGVVVVE